MLLVFLYIFPSYYLSSLGKYTLSGEICAAHCSIRRMYTHFANPAGVQAQVGNKGKLLLTTLIGLLDHVIDTLLFTLREWYTDYAKFVFIYRMRTKSLRFRFVQTCKLDSDHPIYQWFIMTGCDHNHTIYLY